MICKRRGTDDSDATSASGDPQLEDIECNILGPDLSPCDPCKELADLKILMARLIKRRSELKRNINRIHSPFLLKIPAEIIAKISEFMITDATIGLPSVLLLLTSICSDWRQIIVGTPQFWSSIRIDLPFDMVHSKTIRMVTFIDGWLTRSGELPLHISLGVSSGPRGSRIAAANPPEIYHPIFKTLNRYSSRWHSLNISIPPALFSYLQPDCLPLLEQLHVKMEFQEDYTGMHEYPGLLTFPPSPHLKAVGIAKTSINFGVRLMSLFSFGIQWDTVTHVSTEWLTIRESLKLLLLTPRLVHGKLHNIVGSTRDNPFLESPIVSPLIYLSLSCSQGSPSRFFDNLILPSLDTLLLSDISPTDSLIACLERSACSLHTISLEYLWIGDFDNLIRLLQLLSPSLKKLELVVISGDDLNDSNLQYLSILSKTYSSQIRSAMGDYFLPHLQTFKFGVSTLSNSTTFSPNLVTWNHHPRLVTSIPLRSVHINLDTIPNPIPQDILSLLEHLKEDGIVVTLE